MSNSNMRNVLGSCANPSCAYFQQATKAPLKCAKCKTVRYCDKDCQRAHWSAHKQFCAVWADTSAEQGESIAKVKKKMADFIWLVRGFPELTDFVFKCNTLETRQGNRGCMEFEFMCFEDLFEAVRILEAQPVVKEVPFFAMPHTPSYRPSGMGSGSQKIKLRTVRDDGLVEKAVGSKLQWIEDDTRANMQKGLDLVAELEDMMLLSVTVRLKGTFATHTFDLLYKNLSYRPGPHR